jgi:hypothetical protein
MSNTRTAPLSNFITVSPAEELALIDFRHRTLTILDRDDEGKTLA